MDQLSPAARRLVTASIDELKPAEASALLNAGRRAVLHHCVQWGCSVGLLLLRDQPGTLAADFTTLARDLAVAAMREFESRHGTVAPARMPATPQGLKIEHAYPSDEEPLHIPDCPRRIPENARNVAHFEIPHSPGLTWSTRYALSGVGPFWVLWQDIDDVETEDGRIHWPTVWCPSSGISEHDAAIFLLRRLWAEYKAVGSEPGHLMGDGLLNADEIYALYSEFWPLDGISGALTVNEITRELQQFHRSRA